MAHTWVGSPSLRWNAGRWLLVGCVTAAVLGPQPVALADGTGSDPNNAPVTYYVQPAAALSPTPRPTPAPAGRVKPDLVGPDAVSTLTFGTGGFPGTSASSPHVAGAAAIIKSANPGFGPAQLKSFLLGNAVDIGAVGPDNQSGAGRLDLGVPPIACANRTTVDKIGVTAARTAQGRLQVTLTPQNSTIRLRSVQFGDSTVHPSSPVNSLVDILAQVGATGNFSTALPDRPTGLQFVVRKADVASANTVPIGVTDGCGTWRTLVGAGPGLSRVAYCRPARTLNTPLARFSQEHPVLLAQRPEPIPRLAPCLTHGSSGGVDYLGCLPLA